jgi:hypothetical protein
MRLTQKTAHMMLGGALTLAGFAAAHVVIAVATPTGDTFDTISVRDLRVVDESGATRVCLHVAAVDDPGGPIDVIQVTNGRGSVVHRVRIYQEGRGGATISVGNGAGVESVRLVGAPETVDVLSGQGDGRTRATMTAGPNGATIAAVGIGGEVYVAGRDGRSRAASLRADYNGGVLSITNGAEQPRVILRVTDDDRGAIKTVDE